MSKILQTTRITLTNSKTWNDQKKILVILAHPDDPEFFCGGTLAKWACEGHQIKYCLLTHGEKGTNAEFSDTKHIKEIREQEQQEAATTIGAQGVMFLNHPDGFLEVNLSLRKELVRVMRKEQPDIVVSCDPSNYFRGELISHPDHRATGLAVIEAIFPAAQNDDFYPELLNEGLNSHHIQELWLSLPIDANIIIDVTAYWDKKIAALLKHKSQIGDPEIFIQRMKNRGRNILGKKKYFEEFHRLMIRK
ncbi:MAG: PIG-L deacetylase family protein [Anaerolineaceae bacterium]